MLIDGEPVVRADAAADRLLEGLEPRAGMATG
jgi:hypothetical protein